MKRYLDPKNDLVFKRVFGEHPDILRAFLNATLPLGPDEKIVSLVYLPPEQTPEVPHLKHSIVDIRCKDHQGRQFIVEMQMQWSAASLQRVLYNVSKAYVRQLERGESYNTLEPVIGLSLLNDVFDNNRSSYYHHYKMLNIDDIKREIRDLQLVFIELPKFNPPGELITELDAWLHYLRKTGQQEKAPEELALRGGEIKQALELAESTGYTPEEMYVYDKYWDNVSIEKTLIAGGMTLGKEEGIKIGLEQGIEKGIEQGLQTALQLMLANGISEAQARDILKMNPLP